MESCAKCSACCFNVSVEVDAPEDDNDVDQYVWLLLHEGVTMYVEGGDWHVEFKCRCKALAADGTCGIYEDRPKICRDYCPSECLRHGEGDFFDEYFKTPQELLGYWKNKGKKKKD